MKLSSSDYVFISARISAMEKKLMPEEAFGRLRSTKNMQQFIHIIEDYGYSNSASSIENAVKLKRDSVIEDMEKYTPNGTLLMALFKIRYDYNNAKAVIKGVRFGLDFSALLSDSGRFPAGYAEDLLLHSRENSALSHAFAGAVKEADRLLGETSEAVLSDAFLDRAMFSEMLDNADRLGDVFLKDYVRFQIDIVNINILVRAALFGASGTILQNFFVDGGNVKISEHEFEKKQAIELIEKYFGTPFETAAKCGVDALSSNADFANMEAAADKAMREFIREGSRASFGSHTVVRYIAACEREFSTVRRIAGDKGLLNEKIASGMIYCGDDENDDEDE